MDFLKMLEGFGPFTTPLCVAMVVAIKWLLSDRARLIEDLKASNDDAKVQRDKRTEDQKAAAIELREFTDVVTHRLEEWSKRADRSLPPPKE